MRFIRVALALVVASQVVEAAPQSRPSAEQAKPQAPPPAAPAQPTPTTGKPPATPPVSDNKVVPPPDYVIGAEDVLEVVFWREKELSGEVTVRPDGMVSLPLLNDVRAAGLTPEAFREQLTQAAARFVEEPNATVIVKQINSRKVYIMGNVAKPGPYPLGGPMTVLHLLGQAGGLTEYADAKNITVIRTVGGKPQRIRFNYREVSRGQRVEQDVELKPGDTVIVP